MIDINTFISHFYEQLPCNENMLPWQITNELESLISKLLGELNDEYRIENNIAIHKCAILEQGVILKGSMIISADCYIGAHAYLRGPIYFGNAVKIGPSSEIKQSIILDHTAIAHFNYVGNSIIGRNVNFEAGSICANHYNERINKSIYVLHEQEILNTQSTKFGALVGDHSKIGANAVLSPGTLLRAQSIVKRLELVEQVKEVY
jgi:NDP-sugar pyrophosphorylase family protein